MREPNSNGVYEPEAVHDVARHGGAYVQIETAQCRDGLFRYAVHLHYSYGGLCSPITDQGEGFATEAQARDAGILKALARFPRGQGDPESARSELQALRQKLEGVARQPTLF